MVEAAGIEPASEGIPLEHLHAYPVFLGSHLKTPTGRILEVLAYEGSPLPL